ncbi:MAG: DnaJ domain-containing protein [Rhodospirillales bacterium]|jgi:DnaJ-domain-containing protein 1|nr:DnaJ domain-containing protein [Rhodospirillales bacterium]
MKSKSTARAYNNKNPQQPVKEENTCEWPECQNTGEHRAPRSRDELNSYRWFCLEHIRQYNKSWNYYDGMDDTEVEADKRHDTVWQRPSWKLGINATGLDPEHTIDPFDILGGKTAPPRSKNTPPVRPPISKEEEKAYKVLGLEYPTSATEMKVRYKELVKIHHPDANKGAKSSEEKIKKINQAYHILRDSMNN